ncbi:hypothetical protein TIFTF001_008499 [Ficus carica]|uniref:Uncharacterized protein n=1 Tax=Ficus carica TaxID=3494 RepID=A0AA88D1S3_FICCA|nr:hypothetical protein TIFTF001_008499 [Ficus carica]
MENSTRVAGAVAFALDMAGVAVSGGAAEPAGRVG